MSLASLLNKEDRDFTTPMVATTNGSSTSSTSSTSSSSNSNTSTTLSANKSISNTKKINKKPLIQELNNDDDISNSVMEKDNAIVAATTDDIDEVNEEALKKKYLKHLNNNFKKLINRDNLEFNYQNWKYINLQEFELITDWNTMAKEPNALLTSIAELYQLETKEIELLEQRLKQERQRQLELLNNTQVTDTTTIDNSASTTNDKQESPDRPSTSSSSSSSSSNITSDHSATTTTTTNNNIQNHKIDDADNDANNNQSPKKINKDENFETENHKVIENEEDDEDTIHNDDELPEDDMIPLEYTDKDTDDKDFHPSMTKSQINQINSTNTLNKTVTIDSSHNLISKELYKMVNKNKIIKIRKRRFTNAIVTNYQPTNKKIIIKITLKQYHVRRLKKLINDAKKLEEKRLLELELKLEKERKEKLKLEKLAEVQKAKELAELNKNSKNKNKNSEIDNDDDTNSNNNLNNNDSRKRKFVDSDGEGMEGENGNNSIAGNSEGEENDDEYSSMKRKLFKLDLPDYGMNLNVKEAKAIQRHYNNTYISIWKDMARKDSSKMSKLMQQIQSIRSTNFRKTSALCARESKKWQARNFKQLKDFQTRARRGIREMSNYWKKNEKEERDLKKKAEKEALELARKEEEVRENKRQTKKLNFLLTQTELYSHFIGKKIKTDELEGNDGNKTESSTSDHDHVDLENTDSIKTDFKSIDFDNEDDNELRVKAAQNASNALRESREKTRLFDSNTENSMAKSTEGTNTTHVEGEDEDEDLNFQNPTSLGDINIEQPNILACTLKEYQLKGLNWLANLYDQGINGILADEMGLGKTVQSISVLAHLAERYNIWGPFLVVTPASTLHNWVNEITKFVPQFKILPYWGNANDRKTLRKFWDRKNLRYKKESPFHVMITSYQMVVSDASYLQKMKWQYMILDEAQAIKSSQSSRWKNLLSFHCRNRLLLTGTPIQNNMQELWALLHFIMPSLFDSHDEFNEWFSKDIESHAETNTQLNQQQLRRLHMILKPFMLRRIKKNVQSELGDKIEIDLLCDLTQRQEKLYKVLKSQVSSTYDAIEDAAGNDELIADQSLVNTVMQFRKVCNHPDLFERADIASPFSFVNFGKTHSLTREDKVSDILYSTHNPISYYMPRLIFEDILLPNFKNDLEIRDKLLNYKFNVFHQPGNSELSNSLLVNLKRLTGLDSNECSRFAHTPIFMKAIDLLRDEETFPEKLMIYDNEYEDESNHTFDNFKKSLIVVDKQIQISRLSKVCSNGVLNSLMNIRKKVYDNQYFNSLSPSYHPGASAPPISFHVFGSSNATIKTERILFNPIITQALSEIPCQTQYNMLVNKKIPLDHFPVTGLYPEPLNKSFSSYISMPSMDRFITESAKLKRLDQLLVELKKGDHRVLVYFQMTKMMDLMEEYLTYRQYTYIRLDGSSKLEDRRDLVHDWQTKPDIFVFLLSTRAGGLGINLTSADTVVFYDSDWNPTIDSQAMDRAHRLGQTRQVTVYRLLVRGTIEERMRDRAKQKEHVQQVVMEGKTKEDTVKTITEDGKTPEKGSNSKKETSNVEDDETSESNN
ncbi:hypothetical protein TBLA_0B07120 [Henningerozyma blattae CBS 6284]|uniref:Chromatin-remodeling ATPase INO80 n=1 Tax=Henningerozyma blattae (strain ATCC 34711 / CBS 6284 / DSM 70876 / NBRC 10599 / NRRL Y-10934 / UCD 77-7) TaxID=1071380 RepID=I2GZH7_HENB6|nr:hypothetical protein TBLA_0B07120 [Tetrapisispora blattae CBS 6284]CCH59529.1 hypothetical protein TBLA_0B07120 [Tetrapisispora blattae CBS 6284]